MKSGEEKYNKTKEARGKDKKRRQILSWFSWRQLRAVHPSSKLTALQRGILYLLFIDKFSTLRIPPVRFREECCVTGQYTLVYTTGISVICVKAVYDRRRDTATITCAHVK
jgi:hypothetical protein